MLRKLKVTSVVATIGMTLILMGGALVTKTGSADGCGRSWPLCNGKFMPTNVTPELLIELSHRLVSGVVSIAVLLLCFWTWKQLPHIREARFLSLISISFLLVQALIGAAAVMWGQSKFILAAHFGISLISFASVFLLTLLIFEVDKKFDASKLIIRKSHRIEIYCLMAYTLIAVYTGALVRHAKANLVCGGWPFCNNAAPFAFNSYNHLQWIQMGHRLAALLLFIWTLSFYIRVRRTYQNQMTMKRGWQITFLLICMQVVFGALIIFSQLNLGIALMHALVISCYFGMISYFVLLSERSAYYEKKANAPQYEEAQQA
ncbi:heme A synthase [Aciduricibacillus chroicocephali]|uniref:Heme A synthase n=1 Tax=Aciduricibacillus chroicocephali TaxID=3054939 RepID=A0ABY9KY46_9BACI|nr:heme A synthase [Bacillaceae bacterium 44XB]